MHPKAHPAGGGASCRECAEAGTNTAESCRIPPCEERRDEAEQRFIRKMKAAAATACGAAASSELKRAQWLCIKGRCA